MSIAKIEVKLRELARNLWWTWQPGADFLMSQIDADVWVGTNHNPIEFLNKVSPERIEERAPSLALHSRIDSASRRLGEYLGPEIEASWGAARTHALQTRPVAYFSAEFGLHESLPIYSGGLGVLAGDHLKSASDLGIPLVGVGLLYNQGYFSQSLDANGWQMESYNNTDTSLLPVEPAVDDRGEPVRVAVETRGGALHARVWKVQVGRNPLYLLDADVPENTPEDRALTARLYGGDARVRIRQELLLGVGGLRALHALGIRPGVIHLNEGHSAFATLEMIRTRVVEQGDPFWTAAQDVAAMTVFTTHTPVAAGHDRFWADLVEENLGPMREALHLSYESFLGLGRVHPEDHNEPFCMTVLALKLSRRANGVSALHGAVSRQMWHPLYPGKSLEEVPIGHITNGVHVNSWLAPQIRGIYDRALGPDWPRKVRENGDLRALEKVDDAELWENHQILKAKLIDFTRTRLVAQAKRRGESGEALRALSGVLDLETLTIGFARRFATYKRAGLALNDAERLAEMINSADRPIQLIFAGKAHPEDRNGKELIQSIVARCKDPKFFGRIVFIEDYDMNVARHLVQGVDVWLNNPRRPQEASGTSGQKAALNGVLNCSILDGWWAEGYDGRNGFAIGHGATHQDVRIQDQRDQEALLETLAKRVIPLYYERDADNLPRGWIARMKHSMTSLAWRFSAERMVMDYTLNCYLPAGNGRLCLMPPPA